MLLRKMFVLMVMLSAVVLVFSSAYASDQPADSNDELALAPPGEPGFDGPPPAVRDNRPNDPRRVRGETQRIDGQPFPGPDGAGPGPGAQIRQRTGIADGLPAFGGAGVGPAAGPGMGRGMGGIAGPKGPMGPRAMMALHVDPESRDLVEKEQRIQEEVRKIVERYPAVSDKDEQAKLKTKLTDLTSEQFGVRQELRELQVKRLEKELAKIRDALKQRTENKEQIIKRHVAQLLRENEGNEF